MEPRASKGEVRARCEAALEVILNGGRFKELRELARENGWNVTEGQLRRYQTVAYKLADRLTEKDRAKNFALAVQRRELLFCKAMTAGDFATAMRIERDRCELFKLYDDPDTAKRIADLSKRLAEALTALGSASGG